MQADPTTVPYDISNSAGCDGTMPLVAPHPAATDSAVTRPICFPFPALCISRTRARRTASKLAHSRFDSIIQPCSYSPACNLDCDAPFNRVTHGTIPTIDSHVSRPSFTNSHPLVVLVLESFQSAAPLQSFMGYHATRIAGFTWRLYLATSIPHLFGPYP